jgi:hypothetical protein
MRMNARKQVRNEGSPRFKSAPLHNPVPQLSDLSENRSKFARVRAISYQRMNPESGSGAAKCGEYGKTYPPSILLGATKIRSNFAFLSHLFFPAG